MHHNTDMHRDLLGIQIIQSANYKLNPESMFSEKICFQIGGIIKLRALRANTMLVTERKLSNTGI